MTKIWFTSDTHFNHKFMAELRGFYSVEDMDQLMIDNWNTRIRPGDIVYHGGDFAFGKASKIADILHQLNGGIRLIEGNHDRRNLKAAWVRNLFASIDDRIRLKAPPEFEEGWGGDRSGRLIVLDHYPHLSWEGMHRGAWMLHGHSHGNLTVKHPRRVDLSTNCWGYEPVSWAEIVKAQRNVTEISPVDHHA